MANLQTQFQNFHRNIKVESETLREKRDKIYDKIKKSLSEEQKPVPETLNQGSYVMELALNLLQEKIMILMWDWCLILNL